MDRGTEVVAEDCVVRIFAFNRETRIASLFFAIEGLGAEIPAPRPLAEIPSNRRGIADLRRSNAPRGFSEGKIALAYPRVIGNLRQRYERSETQTRGAVVDFVETGHRAQIDKPRGRDEPFLEKVHQ